MTSWQWENFIEILTNGMFGIDNPGPLHYPVASFKIYRDENLTICLETICKGAVTCNSIEHPPGTIRKNEDFAEIVSVSGLHAKANGLLPLTCKRQTGHSENNNTLTEQSTVSEIILTLKKNVEECYVIEWLTNVDSKYYIWPDLKELKRTKDIAQVLKSGDVSIKTQASDANDSLSRDCIFLKVAGHEFFFGASGDVGIDSSFMPGYIVYLGVPTEAERRKIRLSLSFAFGRSLVYMGHSIFSEDWTLTSCKALSPYTIDGKVFKLLTLPPAPLWKQWLNELNREKFTNIVNAFYRYMEASDLEHVSWLYWHAVTAPTHMAALNFGATFEAIQRIYIEKNGELFENSLFNKDTWKIISKALKDVVEERLKVVNANSELKTPINILINKINNLNETPKSELTDRFLDSLRIGLSENEKDAWRQRNKAAHGFKTETTAYANQIKQTKLLKVLCNRVLLSIARASDQYIDYYSIGFPVKRIQDAIE